MANFPSIKIGLNSMPSLSSSQSTTVAVALQDSKVRKYNQASNVSENVVPAYTLTCADKTFVQGHQYSLSVLRDIAPSKQTQIEVECTGGFVSPVFLVDEGEPFTFDNQKIEVTPTDTTCNIKLICTIGDKEYGVGKYTMNNIAEY